MPEWPTPRETLAWARDAVARSKSIRADAARVRSSARATRSASQRLREQARAQRTTSINRGNG